MEIEGRFYTQKQLDALKRLTEKAGDAFKVWGWSKEQSKDIKDHADEYLNMPMIKFIKVVKLHRRTESVLLAYYLTLAEVHLRGRYELMRIKGAGELVQKEIKSLFKTLELDW
jgi:hypothetical protein